MTKHTEIERHATSLEAMTAAKRIAGERQITCYVIHLNRGWCVYLSTDKHFSDHRPAQYFVVEAGA